MGEEKNTIVIKKQTLIVVLILLSGVGFFVWNNQQEVDLEEKNTPNLEIEDIDLGSMKEEFDRKAAIEELSEVAYYDCYDEIIKLNPTRTTSEDLEYFREVCKIRQKDYALSLEEYNDSFLEYLLTPEGRKSMREIREEIE